MSDKERLTWKAADVQISQCAFCQHKQKASTCAAFPKGIPDLILSNQFDHRQPCDGDNNLQFEPVNRQAAKTVDAMFGGKGN